MLKGSQASSTSYGTCEGHWSTLNLHVGRKMHGKETTFASHQYMGLNLIQIKAAQEHELSGGGLREGFWYTQ